MSLLLTSRTRGLWLMVLWSLIGPTLPVAADDAADQLTRQLTQLAPRIDTTNSQWATHATSARLSLDGFEAPRVHGRGAGPAHLHRLP
jgi:hypothetical protein